MGESFQEHSWIQDFEADFPSWIKQIPIVSLIYIQFIYRQLTIEIVDIWVGIMLVFRFDF